MKEPVIRLRWVALALLVVAGIVIATKRLGVFESRPMPAVAVTTINGDQYLLDSLRGNVVLVNFWATTCASCIREMPTLVNVFEKYQPRGYRMVAVAMPYDPPNRVLDYARTRKLPFDVVLDVDGSVLRAFGDVPGTPTSFLVDRNGNIIHKYLGEPDFADLRERIEDALGTG